MTVSYYYDAPEDLDALLDVDRDDDFTHFLILEDDLDDCAASVTDVSEEDNTMDEDAAMMMESAAAAVVDITQFERMDSFNNLHFHTIEESICSSNDNDHDDKEEEILPLPIYSYYQPKRSQSQRQQQQPHHQVLQQQCQQHHQQSNLPRQASVSDMSMCSYTTANSYATAHSMSALSHQQQQPDAARSSSLTHSEPHQQYCSQQQYCQQEQYQEPDQPSQVQHRPLNETVQLQKLAESMKRTEQSRHQVMMHRSAMSMEQRAMEEMVRNQVQQQVQNQVQNQYLVCQVQHQQSQYNQVSQDATIQLQQQHHQQQAQHRSSIMSAFFSGSHTTLTNGMEHSRRQLGLYMSTT